jgi:hypothetical protein
MTPYNQQSPPAGFGSGQDAEALRKWSFLQRMPQQRLDWLVQVLELAYRSGALKAPTSFAPRIAIRS